MELPPYFLTHPGLAPDSATAAKFDRLFAQAVEQGPGNPIDYTLAAPKWQFLCYLSDAKDVVLHGSGSPDIEEFEPRRSYDTDEFGNRTAVYAATNGIWPMYFASIDKTRGVTSLLNSCFRVVGEHGEKSEPYYYFSINSDALPQEPWQDGTIYLLPRATFEPQPPETFRGMTIQVQQSASLVPVRPLAKLSITPGDFPFLSQVHPHDPQRVAELFRSDPDGFPWPEEQAGTSPYTDANG